MSSVKAQITALFDTIHDAKKAAEAEIKRLLPVGTVIWYEHGDYEVCATVLGHSWLGERLFVRGNKSNKEYWIGSYRVICKA